MREYGRFAVSFLSLLVLAAPILAADVRDTDDPRRIGSLFPNEARLRVVNVWATWCAPCVAEMPDLQVIDETFGNDVAVAGVSLDDLIPGTTKEKVVTFLQKQKIAFPNIYYTGSPDALADHLRFNGELPVTIIFDRRGKELWRHEGRLDRKKTIAEIRELLRRHR